VRRGLVGVLTLVLLLAIPVQSSAAVSGGQLENCGTPDRQVILVMMDGLSYEDALERHGLIPEGGEVGIGLMTAANDQELSHSEAYVALGSGGGKPGSIASRCAAVASDLPGPREEISAGLFGSAAGTGAADALLQKADLFVVPNGSAISPNDLWGLLSSTPADDVMVVMAAPVSSRSMRLRGDEVAPLMISRGRPDELARTCVPVLGCAQGLTSDTTRRDGIVSNVDVAPTILDFLGLPIPGEMTGSPIRIEGEPPTRLHQRYLQYQRIHTPIGLLALAVAIFTILVSLGVILARWPAPASLVKALGILALGSVALPVVMLPSSLLPRLTYSLVLPTLAGAAALVTIVALLFGRHDSAAPVAIVAGMGMGVVILDGILGWPAMTMPLLGDSALEGVRFYGMGNAFAGVYMAGAVLLAARIPPVNGMALLVAAGLLAGLPGFGAELGTSLTLFAAAGLWYMFRVRERFGLREVATAGAVTIVGLAAILVIHRFSPIPTHVTRVVQDTPGDFLSVFGRRLALNVRNTNAIPSNWLIVALLPVGLAVAWKRLGPFGSMLRRDPAWRDATVVLALSSIIGYLVNDTIGVAGLGVTYLSAALIYPTLRERWTSG
jgi:hypothetical protein